MSDSVKTPYEEGHLIVSAIRVLTHKQANPVSPGDVAALIDYSTEKVLHICRRLQQDGIIKSVEGPYDQKLYIMDHIKLEKLAQDKHEQGLKDDIAQHESRQASKLEDVKKQQHLHKDEQQNLFNDLEKQLKEGPKKKKNPLDFI